MTSPASNNCRGFTLIELMVALTIGLLVTLAIGSLFITTRQDYRQNDSTAKMQENARFTLDLLVTDLRHAGFFGSTPDPATINVDIMAPAATAQDCGPKTASGRPGLYNFATPNLMLNFGNQIADATAYYGTCFTADDLVKPNSSILLVKRVAGLPTKPWLRDDPSTDVDDTTVDERVNGTPYVYSNGSDAVLYTDTTKTLTITNGEHWQYQPRFYYIDTTDHLRRKELSGLSLVSQPLAEGIEAFHIEFGIDKYKEADARYDGVPDYFYTPDKDKDTITDPVTDVPALSDAVSATVYVLVRTTDPDPDPTFQDTKTYTLGATGPTYGPFGGTGGTKELIDGKTAAASRNDYRYSYHHRIYSTTVMLRNIRNQVMAR